ncbi:MAG: YjbQ family protein [Actinomycetota bacterium]
MHSRVIQVTTGARPAVVDVTAECRRFLVEVAAGDGLLHLFVPHATAGLALVETGAGTEADLLAAVDALLPADPGRWGHRHGTPGHGRDHVLPAFVAPYASLPVVGGQLALGTWQSVVVVDPNRDNSVRRLRLSFLPG